MPKAKSIGIEAKRTYFGEEHCSRLLQWLNEPEKDAGRRRVFELLDLYRHLGSGLKSRSGIKHGRQLLVYERGDFKTMITRLESLCRRYAYYPLFMPFNRGLTGYGLNPHWMPASKKRIYAHGWAIEYDQMNAVYDLARLGDAELLERLRTCCCGSWFFARFEHKRFCSAKCRERAFRSDPAEKEKRRKWARKYYWLQKHANVK